MSHDNKKTLSTRSPLAEPFFRILWVANLVSLVGTWVQDVGVSWLMTSLNPSPFMVALVQTATMLPFFLLALPAGALADILDRRRILLFAQLWMLLAAFGLGVTTVLGVTTPLTLLVFTFVLSLGAALNGPAWQAIVPELVGRDQLPAAVALGSVGFNIARVLGPALGGLVVAAVGPGGTFLLNGASFLGVMAVLKRWRRVRHESALPAERLLGAMRVGVRYVRNSTDIRAILIHGGIFSFFSAALWAFLPIIARKYMGLTALGYGSLLGFFGVGGLLGAMLLPWLRRTASMNVAAAGTTLCFALVFLALSRVHYFSALALAMCIGGMAWMVLLSILTAAVPAVTPSWVRGRVMSVFMLVVFGGLSGGSILWGSIAVWTSIPVALRIAAGCLVMGGAITWPYKLSGGEGLDFQPFDDRVTVIPAPQKLDPKGYPLPVAVVGSKFTIYHEGHRFELTEKPVLVAVEYHIDPDKITEFMEAMKGLKAVRLRDGATSWTLLHDMTAPSHYVESFVVESWVEHLRLHERFTIADREILDRVRAFQAEGKQVRVRHFAIEPIERAKGGSRST